MRDLETLRSDAIKQLEDRMSRICESLQTSDEDEIDEILEFNCFLISPFAFKQACERGTFVASRVTVVQKAVKYIALRTYKARLENGEYPGTILLDILSEDI